MCAVGVKGCSGGCIFLLSAAKTVGVETFLLDKKLSLVDLLVVEMQKRGAAAATHTHFCLRNQTDAAVELYFCAA